MLIAAAFLEAAAATSLRAAVRFSHWIWRGRAWLAYFPLAGRATPMTLAHDARLISSKRPARAPPDLTPEGFRCQSSWPTMASGSSPRPSTCIIWVVLIIVL